MGTFLTRMEPCAFLAISTTTTSLQNVGALFTLMEACIVRLRCLSGTPYSLHTITVFRSECVRHGGRRAWMGTTLTAELGTKMALAGRFPGAPG